MKSEVFDHELEVEAFEKMTENAADVQIETLRKILEQNGNVEYLQGLGLGGRTDPGSFKACVPLVTHEDLESYIQRIVDGDGSPILMAKPITTLSLSSGTTQGKSKFLPFTDEMVKSTVQIYRTTFAFINSIAHALRTFEELYQELCHDIRCGVLSSKITIPSIRDAVSKMLSPDPNLADSIYRKCSGLSLTNWYGMIPEMWPNAKYAYGIMTGSMEPYAKKLQHYAGNVPVLSSYYGASEGWIGANVNPRAELEAVAYAVFPDISYFEFLPFREHSDEEKSENVDSMIDSKKLEPVGLTEVKVGNLYEVIITNFLGLYRYRLGDIVKVASFHNSTPELGFVCRRNNLLSINIDKNTEKDIQIVIDEASLLLSEQKLEIVDFTSHADIYSDPGHYVIFLELNKEAEDGILNRCSNCLDLAFVESAYVRSRKSNIIGPLELRVVCKGTFTKIIEHYASMGTTMSQFKMPCCVGPSNAKVLKILCGGVVKSYFSTAYDH